MFVSYAGVQPPMERSVNDFDPAAKVHIIDNTPYIRYNSRNCSDH